MQVTNLLAKHVCDSSGCLCTFSNIKGKSGQFDGHFIVSVYKPLLETNHKTNRQGSLFGCCFCHFSLL